MTRDGVGARLRALGSVLANLALALVSIAGASVIVEVGYRLYLHQRLVEQITRSLVDAPADAVWDPVVGYRYAPRQQVSLDRGRIRSRYATNEHGHISDENYPVTKASDEYRIAAIGDSFTSGSMNTIRWTEELQRELASSPDWSRFVQGRRTRVINFGRDGISVTQLSAVVDHEALRFEPDLLLLNMIVDDIRRRPYYRGGPEGRLGETDPLQRHARARSAATDAVASLDWWSLRPEILHRITGHWSGTASSLTLEQLVGSRYESHWEDAVEGSRRALQRVTQHGVPSIFLLQTTYDEAVGTQDVRNVGLDVLLFSPQTGLHAMRVADEFPFPQDRASIDVLFNVPDDQHPSDEGARRYAKELATLLQRWSRRAREEAIPLDQAAQRDTAMVDAAPVPRIVKATFGGNCGARSGNATPHVAGTCARDVRCRYRVDWRSFDVFAPACAKDFEILFRCPGAGDRLHRVRAAAPAEEGTIVEIGCEGESSEHRR